MHPTHPIPPLQETFLVFQHEMKRSARSAKTLVMLVLYSLVMVISGLAFVALEKFVTGLTGRAPEATGAPAVVLFFTVFALLFLPLLAALVGFDQVSGELQTRSLRFVTLRARRGSLLAGKVVAQLALIVGLTAIVNLGVFGYAAATIKDFPVATGLLAMARFWGLTLVCATVYVGAATLFSCLFRTPLLSLLTSLSFLLVTFVMAILSGTVERLRFLKYVQPWTYAIDFFATDSMKVLGAVGVLSCFTAVFLALSYVALRARDV